MLPSLQSPVGVVAPAAVWPVAAGESCAQLSALGFWCAVCGHQHNTHTAAAKHSTTQQQLLVHSAARQPGERQPGRHYCGERTALYRSITAFALFRNLCVCLPAGPSQLIPSISRLEVPAG